MADPTTELAKEFLEMKNYTVRTDTKFFKNARHENTASDIDIIAVGTRKATVGDLSLKSLIVAEVKHHEVKSKEVFDEIYDDKFRYVDDKKISWPQLRLYLPSQKYDRVLFCLAATDKVASHAMKTHAIKIVTTGLIIKEMAKFFRESPRNWSYYPEWNNYNTVRSLMYYLYYSYRYRDKLTLSDIVWIDPKGDRHMRNKFVELNSKTLVDLIYNDTCGVTLSNLITRTAKRDPQWLKSILKENQGFWRYLAK